MITPTHLKPHWSYAVDLPKFYFPDLLNYYMYELGDFSPQA